MVNQAYALGFAKVGHDLFIWPLEKIVSPEVISSGDLIRLSHKSFIILTDGMNTTSDNNHDIRVTCL